MVGRVERRWAAPGAALLVFAVAASLRCLVIARSAGGLYGVYNYDAGVYYAAADGLAHGQLPYRDFVLVHPPLSSIVLLPAALLGRLTSATTGFAVANLAVLTVGSINAVLVLRLCRRIGCGLPAATLGGLFYAVWFGAVQAEFFVRLEPLGNAVFLLFLLRTPLPGTDPRRARLLGWGALGMVACCVKLWWALPVVVVVGWHVVARRRPGWLVPVALGAALTGLLVVGPFLIAAPGRFVAMVLDTQLGRVHTHTGIQRLVQLYSIGPVGKAPLRSDSAKLALLTVLVLGVVTLVAAWGRPGARPLVVVLVAQLVVLAVSPTFFAYYADFLSVTLAVTLAAACASRTRRVRRPGTVAAGLLVATAVVTTGRFFTAGGPGLVVAFPHRERTAAAASAYRCVTSDSPMMLIELNALDRSFADHCHNWVDVTAVYLGALSPQDRATARRYFQPSATRRLGRYLTRGDAVILGRATTVGISRSALDRLDRAPIVARSGPYVLRRLRG